MAERGGIVISGASTGIGQACAIGLAERGYEVFAGVRKAEDATRLGEAQEGITPVILDVTKQPTIDAARDTVQERLARTPHCGLFNNAGISINGPL